MNSCRAVQTASPSTSWVIVCTCLSPGRTFENGQTQEHQRTLVMRTQYNDRLGDFVSPNLEYFAMDLLPATHLV